MTAGPLTLEDLERLDEKAREFYRLGLTQGRMSDDVLRLTAALRSVMAERDEAREAADLRARLSRAREALGDLERVCGICTRKLESVRAALAEPPGGP